MNSLPARDETASGPVSAQEGKFGHRQQARPISFDVSGSLQLLWQILNRAYWGIEARRVNRGPGEMGNYMSVSAATRGRTSVAWGGICPLGDPAAREPARVVESGKAGRFSRPRTVAGTKCPSAGIELERDPAGRSYLLVEGSLSDRQTVRVSTRKARQWFAPAKVLNTEDSSAVVGEMTLSPSGVATVIWQDLQPRIGGIQPAISYSYSRATRRSGFSRATKLPIEADNHYLIGASATSGSRVIVLWQRLSDFSIVSSTIVGRVMKPTEFVAQPSDTDSLVTGSIVGRPSGALALWSERDRTSGSLVDLAFADCSRC